MIDSAHPVAVAAADVAPRGTPSHCPELFASRMAGRAQRALGALFGLNNFGVSLTAMAPDSVSALRHAHSRQDELVYVLQGRPVLHTDAGATPMAPGLCASFKAGHGDAHPLLNPTDETVIDLEIGDRSAGDSVSYPDDDLLAVRVDGRWVFRHKDGRPCWPFAFSPTSFDPP